jgi:hypothetical protein
VTDPLGSSFRDPSGFVYRRGGTLYRQVNSVFAEQYDRFRSSGLYDALVSEGLLVPHREVDASLAAHTTTAHRVLEPEPMPFISYPYEWSFGELKNAALATLHVQLVAIDHGMSMRDASAYNVQFRAGRPVLIDTLSFEPLPQGRPWVAYAQFCRHFLAPLALMRYRDVRMGQLLRVHVDGIPLDLAAGSLPARARLRPGLLLHLFLHARTHRARARVADGPKANRSPRPVSPNALRGLIQSLERTVRKLSWDPDRTVWSAYYGEAGSYTEAGLEHKRALVEEFLQTASPTTVWDLGANTGMFSRLAAGHAATTVSFEVDPSCVEASYRQVIAEAERGLLPLVMDLANPSPPLGWANAERMSLVERGPADMVLALALVHHLAIANNVPLPMVASFLRPCCTWLAIEFVPKSDPKVQLMLQSREDVFPGYTVEGFERAFDELFVVERREPVKDSDRVLYLMRGR